MKSKLESRNPKGDTYIKFIKNKKMAIRTEQDALLNAVKNNTGSALSPRAATIIAGTDETTGPFFAITALTDAVVDVSECDMSFITGIAANSGTNDFTIPKGVTIYGAFTSIELDSGTVIAYSL
tara:strand:+ start:25 stop:396 length:372 start_codon:yes stop_codon:yes gene_type:complete